MAFVSKKNFEYIIEIRFKKMRQNLNIMKVKSKSATVINEKIHNTHIYMFAIVEHHIMKILRNLMLIFVRIK